jgi:N-acyl-D-amino-acid deacylase
MVELLLRGGEVIDGSGAARQRADVAVDGGRIVAVGALAAQPAHRTLDCTGLIVAPGFIDSHTHDDRMLRDEPGCLPKLQQGVTTVIAGNCGVSLAPLQTDAAPAPLDLMGAGSFRHAQFESYLDAVRAARPALNAAFLVGHTTLRVATMDNLERAANARETAAMQALLARSLRAGAIGLSTGVYYPPARAATTQELIDVGQPLRGGRGVVTMHIRDEANDIDAALREALAVGLALDAPLVLSHHKLMGLANHGRSVQTLALIDAAALQQSVCLDCYPYTASSTMLMPERVALSRDVQVTWSRAEPAAAGRLLSALAAERGMSAEAVASALQPGGAIYFAMDDGDLDRILAHPLTMIGSDGLPHDQHPHPRLWGSFPRVLGHYVRERRLLSLEAAVHKMTGLTARRFGLAGRGVIAPGCTADITVFNAATVADGASFAAPTQRALGIEMVLVNGRLSWWQGQASDERSGALLLRR